jgi:hypothetical protein
MRNFECIFRNFGANESLRMGLEEVVVCHCGVDAGAVQEILKRFGFAAVVKG